nr:uncharacterized protein CI109_005141 [Kwoniella shandongensis]KAA5526565.1 hypothetical protein CI109_005141 [Kwoniella shandongensis]
MSSTTKYSTSAFSEPPTGSARDSQADSQGGTSILGTELPAPSDDDVPFRLQVWRPTLTRAAIQHHTSVQTIARDSSIPDAVEEAYKGSNRECPYEPATYIVTTFVDDKDRDFNTLGPFAASAMAVVTSCNGHEGHWEASRHMADKGALGNHQHVLGSRFPVNIEDFATDLEERLESIQKGEDDDLRNNDAVSCVAHLSVDRWNFEKLTGIELEEEILKCYHDLAL